MSYLNPALHPLSRAIILDRLTDILCERRADFDALACTGHSGLLITPIVADRLQVPIVIVRKPAEHSHARSNLGLLVEGVLPSTEVGRNRALFVDDFVHHGDTWRRVKDTLRDDQTWRWAGLCMYIGNLSEPHIMYGAEMCHAQRVHAYGRSELWI